MDPDLLQVVDAPRASAGVWADDEAWAATRWKVLS